MQFSRLAVVLGLAVAVMGCQIPLGTSPPNSGVRLVLQVAGDRSGLAPRLLLPNAKTVTITVTTPDGNVVASQSQTVVNTTIYFLIPLKWFVTYTFTAAAHDASGEVLASATSKPLLLTTDSTVNLALIPVGPGGSAWPALPASIQPSGGSVGSLNLAAGSSTSFLIDFGSIGTTFTLETLPSDLSAYAQKSDGTLIATPVDGSSLGGESQFLLTYYNAGATSVSMSALGHFTIPIQTIAVTPSTKTIALGEQLSLSAAVAPANADVLTLNWSSLDTSVATVTSAGVVTATGEGTTTIKAVAQDGTAVSGSTVITVTSQPTGLTFGFPTATSLGFSLTAISIDQGTSLKLSTTSSGLATDGTNWLWEADGQPLSANKSGADFTLSTAELAPGTYNLTVSVDLDGVGYDASILLTVVQVKL